MSVFLAVLAGVATQPIEGAVDVALGLGNAGPSGCAVDRKGDVVCWGGESTVASPTGFAIQAQPGDGSIARHGARPRPVMHGVKRFAHSAANTYQMCGIGDGGRVRCFEYGKATEIAGVTGAVDVALGAQFGCAVLGDGSVTCWGSPLNCALGVRPGVKDCNQSAPQPAGKVAGVADAATISLSQYGGCAIDHKGALTCWGLSPFLGGPAAHVIAGVPPLSAISLSSTQVGAITRDGKPLFASFDTSKPAVLAPVPGANQLGAIASVAAGYRVIVWVLADGHVALHGPGLGNSPPDVAGKRFTDPPRKVPGLDDAVMAAVLYEHACFVTKAGRVRCLGSNSYGELADGTLAPNLEGTPSIVGKFEATALPAPPGGVGGCTAGDDLRKSCLAAGDHCALVPPPDYWGGPWCSGVAPPPDWRKQQLDAMKNKPVPVCECTCSAQYKKEAEAARQRAAMCSRLP